MTTKKTTVLCILDGWGLRQETDSNAIAGAHTPNWDQWQKDYPMAALDASGPAVGLPEGQMGNSEVGHMTIGAGRPILQDLPLISKALENDEVPNKSEWQNFINKIKGANNRCHVMGLLSPGGIHSHQDHYLAFVELLNKEGITTPLHVFTDGRDTPPQSADTYVQNLDRDLDDSAFIASISGRFYAMDRDKRWDRTQLAYDALVHGKAPRFQDPLSYIKESYTSGVHDEFIKPAVRENYDGMQDGDAVLLVNFRADRVRQLLSALLVPDFNKFDRGPLVNWAATLGMKEYWDVLTPYIPPLFPFHPPKNTLGEVVAKAGKTQLRAAETEKYAHVTFFLNGGIEAPYDHEDRQLVPSPKVKTYDLKPEMSAPQLTEKVIEAIQSKAYDLIVVNYANPDMVGHTGKYEASVKAVEVVDKCLGSLAESVLQMDGNLVITADHGNIEQLMDTEQNQPHTAHTTNLVPLMVASNTVRRLTPKGTLSDVAPTVLDLMNIEKPVEMVGKSLII